MESPTTELAPVLAALRSVAGTGLCPIGDDALSELTVAVEQVGRLVDALRAGCAAEVDARSRHELGADGLSSRLGFPRGVQLLEHLTRAPLAVLSARIRTGAALRADVALGGEPVPPRYPQVAAAVRRGEVDLEAAGTIIRCLDQSARTATGDALAIAESVLVETARQRPTQCVSDLARVLRDRLDPDGVLPREEEARARRGVRLGRERNGVTPISGALDPLAAALLRSAFAEANAPGAQPRFLSEGDRREGIESVRGADGSETITVRDPRSRDQRQHDVLAGLLTAGVRNTGIEDGQLRSTADVTAVLRVSDLESGTGSGWINGIDEPVSVSTIEMLACDAKSRRMVLGDDGEVLYLGRTRYPFSAAQRRALVASQGGCIFNCGAPAERCDVHHVIPFSAGGKMGHTDIDNAVLVCREHHTFLHRAGWELRMVNGMPEIRPPVHMDPSREWRRLRTGRMVALLDTG